MNGWGRRVMRRQGGHNSPGAEKAQQCHKYFLQYSIFASERPQVRIWGRQTCLLFRCNLTLSRLWHGVQNGGSRNYTYRFQFLPSNFCAPRQSGAHGTCHACHTLDTPLLWSAFDENEPWFWRLLKAMQDRSHGRWAGVRQVAAGR